MFRFLRRLIFNRFLSRFLSRFVRRHKGFSIPFLIVWAVRMINKNRRSVLNVADIADGETIVITRKHQRV